MSNHRNALAPAAVEPLGPPIRKAAREAQASNVWEPSASNAGYYVRKDAQGRIVETSHKDHLPAGAVRSDAQPAIVDFDGCITIELEWPSLEECRDAYLAAPMVPRRPDLTVLQQFVPGVSVINDLHSIASIPTQKRSEFIARLSALH